MKYTKSLLVVQGVFVFLLLFLVSAILYAVARANYAFDIPKEQTCPNKSSFQLNRHLQHLDPAQLEPAFPYSIYLDSANICDVNSIVSDLALLDSVGHDPELSHSVLSAALTTELEKRIDTSFANCNVDSLITLAQWADRFNYYKDLDKKNSKFFRALHYHWLNYISNKLGQFAQKRAKIKYDFKFKYLVAFCQSKKFSPPIGNSNKDKVVNYFIDQNYAYLFNRFWNATGIIYKATALAGLAILIYALYCVFLVHLKRK